MNKVRSGWDAPPIETVSWKKKYNYAMALKDEVGLLPEERHELALMIPSVDKDGTGSWKQLDDDQLHTLLNYLEGYLYITTLKEQRVGE